MTRRRKVIRVRLSRASEKSTSHLARNFRVNCFINVVSLVKIQLFF